MDAKSQIDTLTEQVTKLTTERKKLLTEKVKVSRTELLSEKSQGLPKVKKLYIEKVLGNKSIDFINENFDYTLALFDEEDETSSKVLREKATKSSKVLSEKVDRVEKQEEVIVEQVEAKPTDMYMEGLREI